MLQDVGVSMNRCMIVAGLTLVFCGLASAALTERIHKVADPQKFSE